MLLVIAAGVSLLRGGRYVHDEQSVAPADAGTPALAAEAAARPGNGAAQSADAIGNAAAGNGQQTANGTQQGAGSAMPPRST